MVTPPESYRHPWQLPWTEVDPQRHPFDRAAAPDVVAGLGPVSAIPVRPEGHPGDRAVIRWSDEDGDAWTDAMTRALVAHYGYWALGWRWATNEGQLGGGPVHSWCCSRDSIKTPGATLANVVAGLSEWRAWLEELDALFDQFPTTPLSAPGGSPDWRRGAAEVIARVVERTEAGDSWYAHCEQVLRWFLTRSGVASDRAQVLVEEAIGGCFLSWVAPDTDVVDDVTARLATSLDNNDECGGGAANA